MHTNKEKELIQHFPVAGGVQPGPGKQVSTTCNSDLGRQKALLQTLQNSGIL